MTTNHFFGPMLEYRFIWEFFKSMKQIKVQRKKLDMSEGNTLKEKKLILVY